MIYAKISTAKTVTFGPVLAADGTMSNGALAYTDAKIFKNGTDGALDASATFTHKYEGVYALALTANDLNAVGTFEVALNKNPLSAAPVKITVLAANVYDWLFGTGIPATSSTANAISVDANGRLDIIKVAGTTQTARDIGASVLLSPGTGTGQISLSSGAVTVGTNNDKTGYTASTVSDKTGYSLSQSFPSNFSSLSIDASGRVDVIKINGTSQTAGNLFGTLFPLGVFSGTAQSGTATTLTLDAGHDPNNDPAIVGGMIYLTGGTGSPVPRVITSASGGVAAVSGWPITPNGTTTYVIIPDRNPALDSSLRVLLQPTQTGVTIPTVTNLTNLPAITNNWLTAAGIASDAITAAKIADGAIDAATFASGALDGVWSTATRTLTAGTNIVLAKGTGITGFNDPTAAAIADAVWDETASDHNTAGSTGNKLNSASAPSAAAVADAVWDEAAADHNTAGSMGAKMNAAGAAADPLANEVPGTYEAGTAGYELGYLHDIRESTSYIIGGNVTARSPVTQEGTILTLVAGDDYDVASGQPLEWTDTGGNWPDLTSATITLTIRRRKADGTGDDPAVLEKTGSVVTPTGDNKKVRVEPLTADTADLTPGDRINNFDVLAELATGQRVTLVLGRCTVLDAQTRPEA